MVAKRYQELSVELGSMKNYLVQEMTRTRLKITNGDLQSFESKYASYKVAFFDYIDENSRNKKIIQAMQEAYKATHSYVLALRRRVKNSGVPLTADDYGALYIHKDKPKHPHTRPTMVPVNSIRHQLHLMTEVRTSTGTEEIHGSRSALPKGADGLQVSYAITEVQNPVEPIVYTHILAFSRANFSLEFAEDTLGKWCHLQSRYTTTSGLMGPISYALIFPIS